MQNKRNYNDSKILTVEMKSVISVKDKRFDKVGSSGKHSRLLLFAQPHGLYSIRLSGP